MDISSTRRRLSIRTLSTLYSTSYITGSRAQDTSKRELQKAASDISCRILMSLLIGPLKISSESRQQWTAGGP